MVDGDDEWDMATVLELERIEASAVRSSQRQRCAAAALDAWDAGALGMEMSRQQTELESASQSLKSRQQEVERLAAQLRLKDHELLDMKRDCVLKEEKLQEALSASSAIQRENEALKRKQFTASVGDKRKRDESAPCSAMPQESSTLVGGSGGETVHNDLPSPQAGSFREQETTASIYPDSQEVLQKLYRIWCLKRKEAGSEILTKLFSTCERELHTLLRSKDSEMEQKHCSFSQQTSKTCDSNLHECLKQVLQGIRSTRSLVTDLSKFLSSQNTRTVLSALRILRCLVANDSSWNICSRYMETDGLEPEGNGWTIKDVCGIEESSSLRFSSARIGINLRGTSSVSGGERRDFEADEKALELMKSILELALNHADAGVKHEALSLVTCFVLQTNPADDRFRVGSIAVEAGLLSLLNKQVAVASNVQLQAMRIVHLLINCPKLLNKYVNSFLGGICACIAPDEDPIQDYFLRASSLQALACMLSPRNLGVFSLIRKTGDADLSNIVKELIALLDLELRREEMKKTSSDRPSLLPEALALLFQLSSHPDSSPTMTSFLTTPEVVSRNLNMTNRVLALGSQFLVAKSGRQSPLSKPSMSVVEMAQSLRSKILSNLRDASIV